MVEFSPCPIHPEVMLPVAQREAERHFCYLCAQLQRRATYAKQREETIFLLSAPPSLSTPSDFG